VRILLDECCIETAVRRRRERIGDRLLRIGESDPEFPSLARDLALLDEFLRNADFAALRTACPELDGRAEVTVELRRDDADRITCYRVSSE
jgi:hypothetical protein